MLMSPQPCHTQLPAPTHLGGMLLLRHSFHRCLPYCSCVGFHQLQPANCRSERWTGHHLLESSRLLVLEVQRVLGVSQLRLQLHHLPAGSLHLLVPGSLVCCQPQQRRVLQVQRLTDSLRAGRIVRYDTLPSFCLLTWHCSGPGDAARDQPGGSLAACYGGGLCTATRLLSSGSQIAKAPGNSIVTSMHRPRGAILNTWPGILPVSKGLPLEGSHLRRPTLRPGCCVCCPCCHDVACCQLRCLRRVPAHPSLPLQATPKVLSMMSGLQGPRVCGAAASCRLALQ